MNKNRLNGPRQAQTLRARRGHDFYPPARQIARIPTTEVARYLPLSEVKIFAHYFTPGDDFYIAGIDDDGLAWGLHSRYHEWGYFSLPELEEVRVRASWGDVVVERDCWWSIAPASSVV